MAELAGAPGTGARATLRAFVEAPSFERFIIGVIAVNAVVLGLETSARAMAVAGELLVALDRIALLIFVAELALKLVAYGLGFFRRPWNIFDLTVVGVALLPNAEGLAVLRALRVLRAMRLISMVPRMRLVVEGLLSAIPGLGSVVALLGLLFYVFGVMATLLFGASFPEWFGTLPRSVYSLFQIMTLESWSMGIVRPVMEVYPYAWLYFIPFILITTFAVLNLFIAIIVNAMQRVHEQESAQQMLDQREILSELRALRREMEALRSERTRI